jgi:hypothetical protein
MRVLMVAALAAALFAPDSVQAQDKQGCRCGLCAVKSSLDACVKCNMDVGPWTKKQSVGWCKRCMKACKS